MNTASIRVLYDHPLGGFGTTWPGMTEDEYWDINQNPDGSYRIVNRSTKSCVYAHPDDPAGFWADRVGTGYPGSDINTDQPGSACWYFIFTAMDAMR